MTFSKSVSDYLARDLWLEEMLPKLEAWGEARRRDGLTIDPETAEIYRGPLPELDVIALVLNEWPPSKETFVTAPGVDVPIWFGYLPHGTVEALSKRWWPR